jgi:predicted GIY-YIG superfamily endonuclease
MRLFVAPAKAGAHNHEWRRSRKLVRSDGPSGTYYVYILASGRHGTLYIGVINNLGIRLEQHRGGRGSEFVKKYAAVVGWAKRERAHQLNFESEISGCWWARREGRLCPPYNL